MKYSKVSFISTEYLNEPKSLYNSILTSDDLWKANFTKTNIKDFLLGIFCKGMNERALHISAIVSLEMSSGEESREMKRSIRAFKSSTGAKLENFDTLAKIWKDAILIDMFLLEKRGKIY
jgi:hypothetical protein